MYLKISAHPRDINLRERTIKQCLTEAQRGVIAKFLASLDNVSPGGQGSG